MQSDSIRYCVVMATYNNGNTLGQVLGGVLQQVGKVILVNDGSTDQTSEVASQFPIEIINHTVNQGKGMALRNGFQRAAELGFDYVITIDSDGQHDPADLPLMIQAMQDNPNKLVMGSRNMTQADVPGKSSFGNRFSNFWFWAETGIRLTDTQTGFRAYPLAPIGKKHWFTKRFEFEIEVIVRLAWDGVKYCEQPVRVKYEDDRVSHFRPFKDFGRISILNTVLFTLALLFYLPRMAWRNFSFRNLWLQVKGEFQKSDDPVKLAASVGLGICFAILPIWGAQMLAAFAIASILGLNRIIVLASSNISAPPMTPFVIYLSFLFGSLFVTDKAILPSLDELTLEVIQLQLTQYLIGATLLALLAGLTGGIVTYLAVKIVTWVK